MRLREATRDAARVAIDIDTRRKRWGVARVLPLAGGPLLTGVVILILVASVLPAAFTVATGNLVGAVSSAVRSGGASGHVVVVLAIVSALFLAQQLVVPVIEIAKAQVGWTVTDRMFTKLIRAACDPVGIGHLEDPAFLDKFELAQGAGAANMGPGPASEGLLGFSHRRLQGWATLAVLARFSPPLALMLFIELSVSYRLYLRGLESYASRWAANEETFRRTNYYRTLGLEQQGAKEIRVFGLGSWVAERYRELFTTAMSTLWAKRRRQAAGQLLPIALDSVALAAVFVALGHAALHGTITVGALTTYTGAALGSIVLTQLGNDELQMAWGGQALLAAEDLFATVAPLTQSPHADPPAANVTALPALTIVFDGVSFAYPGRAPLFDGLDLTIEAGRSLAVVGANGAGKTTLIKLLCRLYEPSGGRILVDGVDLRELDAHDWQRRVAAIFQDFNRYEAYSLADNIGLGSIENIDDRRGVVLAANRAGAGSLFESLPKGWDSPMSRQYKDGGELSGGQWQRVALARALFATQGGAGVLVLDEPTSNLDVRGETELYDRFLDVTRGVTTVVISHRFSTVRRADRIVVLADGRVREDGTHEELLAADGFYAEMFRLQASRYDDPAAVDG